MTQNTVDDSDERIRLVHLKTRTMPNGKWLINVTTHTTHLYAPYVVEEFVYKDENADYWAYYLWRARIPGLASKGFDNITESWIYEDDEVIPVARWAEPQPPVAHDWNYRKPRPQLTLPIVARTYAWLVECGTHVDAPDDFGEEPIPTKVINYALGEINQMTLPVTRLIPPRFTCPSEADLDKFHSEMRHDALLWLMQEAGHSEIEWHTTTQKYLPNNPQEKEAS